ncbi:MAG: cytochrome c biogenesis heme-transporting ATPase CcmA [Gammaproteobacteria bacterium]|nr:cytochrome c biogenesis heme-transporting ATPase CcmA [Gammaproteobacteria bacterium]
MQCEHQLSGTGLSSQRGERLLFEDIAVKVGAGQALQIAGPNGCGKTTLLRILCGLVLPLAGEVRWRGRSITTADCRLRHELCYLGYAGGVKLELTPRENLRYLSALQGQHTALSIDEVLERVELYGFEDVPAYTLSAGQRRRVSLARLLLSGAPLWLLDEPLTALDQDGAALAESLMGDHIEAGGVLIFTTHQPLTRPPARTATLNLG